MEGLFVLADAGQEDIEKINELLKDIQRTPFDGKENRKDYGAI